MLFGIGVNPGHLWLEEFSLEERFAVICLIIAVAGIGLAPLWISDMINGSVLPVIGKLGL